MNKDILLNIQILIYERLLAKSEKGARPAREGTDIRKSGSAPYSWCDLGEGLEYLIPNDARLGPGDTLPACREVAMVRKPAARAA